MNIVFISTYNQRCGIATYTEDLVRGLLEVDPTTQISILTEKIAADATTRTTPNTFRIWDRARFKDHIIKAFQSVDKSKWPDVVHIQHEFGLFPDNKQFFELLEWFGKNKIPCFVTLHTVTTPNYQRSFWAGVNDDPYAQYIAHTPQGAALAYCNLIPHGVTKRTSFPLTRVSKLALNAVCPGFISKSKGVEEILGGISKVPGYHLTLVGECRDAGYLNHIEGLVRSFGLENDVTIVNRYVEDTTAYFTNADVVLLGREEETPYSASGQLHTAIGYGLPVICKRTNIHEGVPGVLMYSEETAELQTWLKVLSYRPNRTMVGKQLYDFAQTRTWDVVASMHLSAYRMTPGVVV